MIELINSFWGDSADLVIAGALGGVVRWLSLRDDWKDGVIAVVVGTICAVYLHPIAVPIIEPTIGQIVVDGLAQRSLSGFMLGVGGISVSGFILDMWSVKRRKLKAGGDDGE